MGAGGMLRTYRGDNRLANGRGGEARLVEGGDDHPMQPVRGQATIDPTGDSTGRTSHYSFK